MGNKAYRKEYNARPEIIARRKAHYAKQLLRKQKESQDAGNTDVQVIQRLLELG